MIAMVLSATNKPTVPRSSGPRPAGVIDMANRERRLRRHDTQSRCLRGALHVGREEVRVAISMISMEMEMVGLDLDIYILLPFLSCRPHPYCSCLSRVPFVELPICASPGVPPSRSPPRSLMH